MVRRVPALTIALLVLLISCDPPPPELHRFLGARWAGTPRAIEAAFGLCEGEVVTQVQLRLSDPPVPDGGVLWQIDSPGSAETRFTVGETPSGFTETVAFRAVSLPSQYLSLVVHTNNQEWPDSTIGFRPDDLPSGAFASDNGRVTVDEIAEAARSGCVLRQTAYA